MNKNKKLFKKNHKFWFLMTLTGLFVLCWTGLIVLVLISNEPAKKINVVKKENKKSIIPDPSVNPERFSLYADLMQKFDTIVIGTNRWKIKNDLTLFNTNLSLTTKRYFADRINKD